MKNKKCEIKEKQMKNKKCEIIAIVDRSGSMYDIVNDAIGGFNTFLNGQKKEEGEANFTLVLFDTEYSSPYESRPINEVKELDKTTFVPRGGTALYDAVGKSIVSTQERIKTMKDSEKPDNVIIAILTDGGENASREFTQSAIKKMIEDVQKDSDWGFVFLAANQDATLAATNIGIGSQYAMNFAGSSRGIAKSFDAMNNTVSAYRSGVDKSTLYASAMTSMTDEIDDKRGV
jgi:uncharacterized protein YegL